MSFFRTIVLSIAVGIFSSLAASFVFLFFLSTVEPEMVISDDIARSPSTDGTHEYSVKVINKSDRPGINVRAEMFLIAPRVVPGGVSEVRIKELRLNYPTIPALGESFRFEIREDVESLWNDDTLTFLRFTLVATDPLSGFSRVFVKKYTSKRNDIVDGVFEHVDSLRVK